MNINTILMAGKVFVLAYLSLSANDNYNKLRLNNYGKKINIFWFLFFLCLLESILLWTMIRNVSLSLIRYFKLSSL